MMFLNYPNNPTAATVDKAFLKEAVDFAMTTTSFSATITLTREISYDGYKAPSILEIEGAMDCRHRVSLAV